MAKNPELGRYLQGLIRAEKARHNLTFEDLSQRLARHGIRQSATNLRTKLSRGDMSAQLFLALAKVLGLRSIALGELELRTVKTPRRE
ncbi:MAG: DUF6471 domain-containing protein [Nevskia sp.]|nr:DUF6471 domain-containing protein [Nevskia sp.]